MVKPDTYNKEAETLFNMIVDKGILKTGKKIDVYSNVPHEMTAILKKSGYDVEEYTTFGEGLIGLLKHQFIPDIIFVNWCDRDCWKLFERLPSYCIILSLYQPLFKTGLDHELNSRYLQEIVGISTTYNDIDLGKSNIPWDNKVFVYNFQT